MVRNAKIAGAAAAAAAAVALALAVGPAAGDPQATAAATKRVSVADNVFRPRSTSIRRRSKVRFAWTGDNPHNVTFARKAGRPRNCGTTSSGSCTRRFERRGTYRYVCTIHFGMRGTIRVR